MSMGVQSYPELYTTLLGWQLYDQIWTILTQTGLAFLPFIGIVLRNIGQPYASQETKDAGSTSLRRMELDFLVTLFLIFIAVSPALKLDPTVVSYAPTCQTDGQPNTNTYHPGDTGTTYDQAFTVPTSDLRVPVWWYAVMAMSQGITSGANTLVACVPNLRGLVTQVNMTQISDPELKQQVQQFERDCFIPARTQYLADVHTQSGNLATINAATQEYGAEDPDWVGSHGYSQTYYKELKASQPVKGFIYDASQDINADTNANNPPTYGTPTCDAWWNDSSNGLKKRLYGQLSPDVQGALEKALASPQTQDNVLKNIIFTDSGYKAASNTGDNLYTNVAEGLGSWLQAFGTYPKIYAAAQSAPIIQSLLLLMVYAFLPLALVFTGYKPGSFIAGGVIIFSLTFWTFIWNLVTWTDTALMNAIYGTNVLAQYTPNAMLVDMITGTMIIVAPLFWFSFMGSMGVAVGDLVSRAVMNLNEVGNGAASKGTAAVKETAVAIGKAATKL